jgi:DNA-binding MarR family transcriptional regulator
MEPHDDALSTINAVLNTNRVITEAMEKRLRAEAGLSLAQYEVLYRLNDAPDARLRMVDITRQLRVSKSGVTQLVDRLEENGLVIRESCPTDRRLTYAKLTELGTQALRRGEPACIPVVQEHFARHLSKQDMECVRSALAKVLEGNGYQGDVPCPPTEATDADLDRATSPR